jgi:hypothetical protein
MAPGLPAEVLLVQRGQQMAPAVATDVPKQRSTERAGCWQRRGSAYGCSEVNRLCQELPKLYKHNMGPQKAQKVAKMLTVYKYQGQCPFPVSLP